MNNVIKATTLWLMLGYHAPITHVHASESIDCAQGTVDSLIKAAKRPELVALEGWLADNYITNASIAVAYMHAYWEFTFDQVGLDRDKRWTLMHHAAIVTPIELRPIMQAIVNEISSMP